MRVRDPGVLSGRQGTCGDIYVELVKNIERYRLSVTWFCFGMRKIDRFKEFVLLMLNNIFEY